MDPNKLEALQTMNGLCDTILKASEMNIITPDEAKVHLDMYTTEIKRILELE